MKNTVELKNEWIFITPIGNLILTKAVNSELRIDRVLLVSKEKLPRIRHRWGLNKGVLEFKNRQGFMNIFDEADTFAVVRQKGTLSESRKQCFVLIKDELAILTTSKLGYASRRATSYLNLFGEHKAGQVQSLILNKDDSSSFSKWELTKSPGPLVLDIRWKKFQKQIFFSKLLKILRKETKVAKDWKDTLRKTSILIGKSWNTNDLSMAFLLNVMALELLLAGYDEKFSEGIPKRVDAFLGWVNPEFKHYAKEMYKKRSELVHKYNRENILVSDLLLTDDLLVNLLMNLVNYPDLFGSREKVISFSEKVEAEQKLGIKSKTRPKNMRFLSKTYREEDYETI